MKIIPLLLGCLCMPSVAIPPVLGSDTEKRIETPVKQSIDIRQATQQKEEQWRVEKDKLTARLEQLQEENVQLKNQRNQLNEQVKEAHTRLARKEKQLADIFRLVRLSLFYLSLDRKHCGFYNIASGMWQTLPASHLQEIQAAVDIAAKRRTAELLTLPLGRIVTP